MIHCFFTWFAIPEPKTAQTSIHRFQVPTWDCKISKILDEANWEAVPRLPAGGVENNNWTAPPPLTSYPTQDFFQPTKRMGLPIKRSPARIIVSSSDALNRQRFSFKASKLKQNSWLPLASISLCYAHTAFANDWWHNFWRYCLALHNAHECVDKFPLSRFSPLWHLRLRCNSSGVSGVHALK